MLLEPKSNRTSIHPCNTSVLEGSCCAEALAKTRYSLDLEKAWILEYLAVQSCFVLPTSLEEKPHYKRRGKRNDEVHILPDLKHDDWYNTIVSLLRIGPLKYSSGWSITSIRSSLSENQLKQKIATPQPPDYHTTGISTIKMHISWKHTACAIIVSADQQTAFFRTRNIIHRMNTIKG